VIQRNVSRFAFFALILFFTTGIPLMSLAQAVSPAGSKPSPSRSPDAVQTSSRPNAEDLSERERPGSPLDSELLNVRQQLETEALNRMRYGNDSTLDRVMRDLVPFSVFLVMVFVLLWVLRIALDNRRWYRMIKVQTEMHSKLLDRFASSQEVGAYMESEAGKRFLESPRFDTQTGQPASFPYGRILWSVQAGLIGSTLGCGLLFLRGRVPADGNVPLLVFGTLALMIGLGFILSAVASYILSRHFGLLTYQSEPGPNSSVARGGAAGAGRGTGRGSSADG
jgi:hypothetical protein